MNLPNTNISQQLSSAEMGDRLATIDMGQKVGAAVPLSVGELGSHLTQWPGSRPTSLSSGILIFQPFGLNRHGPKIGGLEIVMCILIFVGSYPRSIWWYMSLCKIWLKSMLQFG